MTLRCLEPSGNGAERTRSQWGTAGSAEEPSPEAARLAKALRELGQTDGKTKTQPPALSDRPEEAEPKLESKTVTSLTPQFIVLLLSLSCFATFHSGTGDGMFVMRSGPVS